MVISLAILAFAVVMPILIVRALSSIAREMQVMNDWMAKAADDVHSDVLSEMRGIRHELARLTGGRGEEHP